MAETCSSDNTFKAFDHTEHEGTEETHEEATNRLRNSDPSNSSRMDSGATTRACSPSTSLIPSHFDLVTKAERTPKQLETPDGDWETSGETGPWVVLFTEDEPGSTFQAENDEWSLIYGRFENRYRHELNSLGRRPQSHLPKLRWEKYDRDQRTSAPMFPSSLRTVENALPDWASMTPRYDHELRESSSSTATRSDANRPSSLYVPKSSFNWADDDEGDDLFSSELLGATSSNPASNNGEATPGEPEQQHDGPYIVDSNGSSRGSSSAPLQSSALSSQPSASENPEAHGEDSTQDDQASIQHTEGSTQHDEASSQQGEDFTPKDEDSNQDEDDLYQDDEQASQGDEESAQDNTLCPNCANLLAENAQLQDDLLAKDAEYSDLSDSFANYGAETHRELENARSMRHEIEAARRVNKSTKSFKGDIAYLATKATTLETENRRLKHVETENEHLKHHMGEQVKHIISKVTAQQAQDIARYRSERNEFYNRMKQAETDAADAEARAQSESDKRLAVMVELQEVLEMDTEMKEELISNEAELKELRQEHAEIKEERDQLKLDIMDLNAKDARLEPRESLQRELAREDAMRQSLDILEDMLAVVQRQQKLQKKRQRVVLPTEEEERVHHARLVALGVYPC